MNPKVEQVALEVGGSHYPAVGGVLLEKFAAAVVGRAAQIAVDHGHPEVADHILADWGLTNEPRER